MQGGAPLERESVGESVAISSKPVSSRRNERQAVLGKTEEQKSLRELSVALTSFAESQSQIKCIFSLYDHDSDGFLTTDQTTLLMRKLGYGMPSAWAYVYRDAVTLPLVSNMPHARAPLPAPFDARFAAVAVCTWTFARKAKGAKDVQSAFARHRPILRHEL